MIQQLSREGKHDKLRGIHLLITLTTIDASPVGFSRLIEMLPSSECGCGSVVAHTICMQ